MIKTLVCRLKRDIPHCSSQLCLRCQSLKYQKALNSLLEMKPQLQCHMHPQQSNLGNTKINFTKPIQTGQANSQDKLQLLCNGKELINFSRSGPQTTLSPPESEICQSPGTSFVSTLVSLVCFLQEPELPVTLKRNVTSDSQKTSRAFSHLGVNFHHPQLWCFLTISVNSQREACHRLGSVTSGFNNSSLPNPSQLLLMRKVRAKPWTLPTRVIRRFARTALRDF